MIDRKRSLLDRALGLVNPVVVRSFAPPLRQVDDDVWAIERKLAYWPGLTLPIRMTVLRLPDGSLVLDSPVAPDPEVEAALRSLGPVAAILAPNSFHYQFATAYLSAFAGAELFVAPGLPERVPSLSAGTHLTSEPPPLWRGVVDQLVFGPIRGLSEVALFHRPSRTLLIADLAFNLRVIDGVYDRIVWRLSGIPSRFGPSRTARLTFLRDLAAAPTLARMLEWDFARIIVAHGEIVEGDAKAEFRRAFARQLRGAGAEHRADRGKRAGTSRTLE